MPLGAHRPCVPIHAHEMHAHMHAESATVVSDACREDVYEFHIQRDLNINKNLALGEREEGELVAGLG